MALQAPNAHSPRAPGRLASHYAPVAPVVLFDALPVRAPLAATALRPQSLVGVYSQIVPEAGAGWLHRTMPADAAAAAHELFAVLREFDAAGVAAIWVQRPPASPEWDGVRDRLQRAAA
jgi:L-threonylcarbamoyladenylate synthase